MTTPPPPTSPTPTSPTPTSPTPTAPSPSPASSSPDAPACAQCGSADVAVVASVWFSLRDLEPDPSAGVDWEYGPESLARCNGCGRVGPLDTLTAPPAPGAPGDASPDCDECGEPMAVDPGGVSWHLDPDGGVDHDADADHVAYCTDL